MVRLAFCLFLSLVAIEAAQAAEGSVITGGVGAGYSAGAGAGVGTGTGIRPGTLAPTRSDGVPVGRNGGSGGGLGGMSDTQRSSTSGGVHQ